jgi:hypothetical protein
MEAAREVVEGIEDPLEAGLEHFRLIGRDEDNTQRVVAIIIAKYLKARGELPGLPRHPNRGRGYEEIYPWLVRLRQRYEVADLADFASVEVERFFSRWASPEDALIMRNEWRGLRAASAKPVIVRTRSAPRSRERRFVRRASRSGSRGDPEPEPPLAPSPGGTR